MSYLVDGQFAVVAHRGGSIDGNESYPENTIEAFANTFSFCPNAYFELDIHKTKDGKIVVMHDPTLDRTTDSKGVVKEMTYAEILKANVIAGSRKAKVPLLEEVLAKFPQSKISVEFKEPGYEEQTVEIIRQAKAQDRVVLASFSQKALNAARRFAPEMCSGFANLDTPLMLIAVKTGFSLIAPRRGNVFQIPLDKNGIGVYSKNFLQLAHRLKKHVHIWTINDEPTMEKLIKDGVDGIITDHPRLLVSVAKRLGRIS